MDRRKGLRRKGGVRIGNRGGKVAGNGRGAGGGRRNDCAGGEKGKSSRIHVSYRV